MDEELQTKYDNLLAKFRQYKLEVIGEKFVRGLGYPYVELIKFQDVPNEFCTPYLLVYAQAFELTKYKAVIHLDYDGLPHWCEFNIWEH